MRAAAVIPAYQVAPMLGELVATLRRIWPDPDGIFVIDDGSTDGSGRIAAEAGAVVLSHASNRGKGVALRTGFAAAREAGFEVAVTIDGDGQHPPSEALRMHLCHADPQAMLIGVRDLVGAGAPIASQRSNLFSDLVLSAFTGKRLLDTQCGLRRYPLQEVIALDGRDDGYGYEAEVLIRAVAAGWPIIHEKVRVIYPPAEERISHFHVVRDPARIVTRVLRTVGTTRLRALLDSRALLTSRMLPRWLRSEDL